MVDQLRSAQQRLRDQRERAREMAAEATRRQADAEGALQSLAAARAQQQSYAEQVRARLDSRLAEAAVLQQRDARLAQQIRDQEAALAAEVAKAAPPRRESSGGGSGAGRRLVLAAAHRSRPRRCGRSGASR